MPAAPMPPNEAERIAAVRSYDILDTEHEKCFDQIAWLAARIAGSPIAIVTLVDSERQWFKAEHGLNVGETHRDSAFCAHAILDTSRPLVVPNALEDPRFFDNPLVLGAPHIRFYAGMPLTNPEGLALGTLCVIDDVPRTVAPQVLEQLDALARMTMNTLELRRATRRLRDMSTTDALTGVANRTACLGALDSAIGRLRQFGVKFGLILIDIDEFQQLNRKQGMEVGDRALVAAAHAMVGLGGEGAVAARIGGDEFAIVLPGLDEASVAGMAEKIRAAVHDGLQEDGLCVTVSVGGMAFAAAPANVNEAIEAASMALSAAQIQGGRSVVWARSTRHDPAPGGRMLADLEGVAGG